MEDADRWQSEHPNVSVVLSDRPARGEDWRAQTGWGWIFKVWFRSWRDSRQAMRAIREQGWRRSFWGRKIRVSVADGYDGQKLADFVLSRWADARIQLRND